MANQKEINILLKAKDEASVVLEKTETQLGKLDKASSGFGASLKSAALAPIHAIGGLTDGLGRVGLAALGAGAVISTAGDAFRLLIGPAMDAQAVAKQLDAVLKSTGAAAGVSADEITAMADALSRVTTFEDEAIVSGQSMLLTFTNIGKDVFPDATEAMLNMSQAMGQDLKSSALQLGKALNDPIDGMTALQRVGVQFTDAQKDNIKALVAMGDTAGAQRVILAELNKEFGGSARAAGETLPGKLTILQNQFGNLMEVIGGPVVTGLTNLIDLILRVDFGKLQLPPALVAMWEFLGMIWAGYSAIFDELYKAAAPLRDAVQELWTRFEPFIDAALQEVFVELQEAWATLTEEWEKELKPALEELWEEVGPILTPVLEQFVELVKIIAGAGVLLALAAALGMVVGGLKLIAGAVQLASGGLSLLVDAVKIALGWATNLADAIGRILSGLQALGSSVPKIELPAVTLPTLSVPGFATGGYTGNYQGLAMLHPRETIRNEAQERAVQQNAGVNVRHITINASGAAEGKAAGRAFVDTINAALGAKAQKRQAMGVAGLG